MKQVAHMSMSFERMQIMFNEGAETLGKVLAGMITANPAKSDLMKWTPDDVAAVARELMLVGIFHAAAANTALEREPGDELQQPPF